MKKTRHNLRFVGEGRLSVCKVCNAAEKELPTHCPGMFMSPAQRAGVQEGIVDFIAGEWVSIPEAPDV